MNQTLKAQSKRFVPKSEKIKTIRRRFMQKVRRLADGSHAPKKGSNSKFKAQSKWKKQERNPIHLEKEWYL
jgi:hypothetical protein